MVFASETNQFFLHLFQGPTTLRGMGQERKSTAPHTLYSQEAPGEALKATQSCEEDVYRKEGDMLSNFVASRS